MRKVSLFIFVIGCTMSLQAALNERYVAYIAQWREVALQHEQTYGIPASITLAQGLLESSAGTSELAVNARNHFGIKCTSDWMGEAYRYDDDRRNECFRVYKNAEESYQDHALFLKNRSRYARLFDIPVSNYQAWANGLKECGYATDPAYAQKLIRVIEDYGLASLAQQQEPKKAVVVTVSEPIKTITRDFPPEYVAPLTASEEKNAFYKTHEVKKNNGVRYVQAKEGDTYASVAFSLNVRERALREQNDALGRTLQAGDMIYLGYKKTQAPKEKTYVWVRPGEDIWMICQREGIQERSFRELNGLPKDVFTFSTRQQVLLRKVKE